MIAAAGRRAARLTAAASIEFGVVFSIGLYAYRGSGFVPYLLDPRLSDFAKYYRDALTALTYGWGRMYDQALFVSVTRQVGVISTDPATATGLSMPQLTWLVAAVAWLPLRTAYVIWLLLLAGCLAGTFWALAPAGRRRLHLALMLGFAPVLFAWGSGQSTILVAAGVAIAAGLLRRRLDLLAGLVLGLATVKPQLLAALPLCLLAVGRWRTVAAWAASLVAMLAIHLVLVGPTGFLGWVGRIVSASASPATWQVTTSVAPVLLLPAGPLRALFQVLVLGAAAWLAHTRRSQLDSVIAVGLVASLLVTSYVHYQDLTILLVVGWLVLRATPLPWERWVLSIGFSQAVLVTTSLPQALAVMEVVYLAGRPAGYVLRILRHRPAPNPHLGAEPAGGPQPGGR